MSRRVQAELVRRIHAHGFQVRFVDWCEDARTPGLLGQTRGCVDYERREVKISRLANPKTRQMTEILAHELRHLDEPEWDCGSRHPLGRRK